MKKYAAKVLGEQLREARMSRSLSVASAAAVLGVKRQMVYNYEKGKSLPGLGVLARAAKAWGATFKLGGCKVLPESTGPRPRQTRLPVQLELAFLREREYKEARVRIKQVGRRISITMDLPSGVRR